MSGNFRHWHHLLTRTFRDEVEALRDGVLSRLLPTFDDIAGEADAAAEAEYARLGALPGDGAGWDMGDAADWSLEAGLAHYERMSGVRQAVLNMATAALYHLYEQQAASFLTREVITPHEERDADFMRALYKPGAILRTLGTRLAMHGVVLTALPSAGKLNELRLAANTVKHGSGDAAEKLHALRPELFLPPELRPGQPLGDSLPEALRAHGMQRPNHLDRPVAGRDLYITPDEYRAYADTVTAIWAEVADALLT